MEYITNPHELLVALDEQLAAAGGRHELVIVGGSALVALEIVSRPTQDVDVLALRSGNDLLSAEPLPSDLVAAAHRVGEDFRAPSDWLNAGPTGLLDLGLPHGFLDRLVQKPYGEGLTVYIASRLDQVHFKLYATVDQGPGRHEADLRALEPTDAELVAAARWTRTQDPSPGFRDALVGALASFGLEDVDLGT